MSQLQVSFDEYVFSEICLIKNTWFVFLHRKHPCNKSTQYVPREFEEEQRAKIASSKTVQDFVDKVAPR